MRLIDADELEPDTDYDDGEYFAYSKVQIDNAPTIEPERKTGKWIPLQLSIAHPPYQCSCCFRNAPMVETGCLVNRHLEALLTDYCPYCGAKMDGGEQECKRQSSTATE